MRKKRSELQKERKKKTEEEEKGRKERKERERKKKEKEAWIRLQEARIVKESTLSAGESCEWFSFSPPSSFCYFLGLNL